jgi:hypothetical protein
LGEPVEELEDFELGDSKKKIQVGSQLCPEIKEVLVEFLRRNEDVFAWGHEDMPGIPPSVIVHRLMVDPSHRPIKQRRRSFAPERNQAVAEEVQKLLQDGFIREMDPRVAGQRGFSKKKPPGSGECALISLISTWHVPKIASLCLGLTCW